MIRRDEKIQNNDIFHDGYKSRELYECTGRYIRTHYLSGGKTQWSFDDCNDFYYLSNRSK